MSSKTMLTLDELHTLQRYSEGMEYKAIAKHIGRPETTIRGRGRRAVEKLGARNIGHAVAIAMNRGDIPGPLVCDGHERAS